MPVGISYRLDLGEMLLDVHAGRTTVREARRRMSECIGREHGKFRDSLKRRYARKCVWSLARLAGGPWMWIWAAWRTRHL
jgi:hypothetical protein